MKKIFFFLVLLVHSFPQAKADEGMWLPSLLKDNYEEMKKLGLKLTPEQLYDINNSSLKDAIAWFNGGCTSGIISDNGLLLTNHHCGYGAITRHSSVTDNILDNGFWAKSNEEEKPNQGMWASILVRMEDVSEKVLKALNSSKSAEEKQKVFKQIEEDAKKETGYEALVRSFFNDNAFYLFLFERFTDIRLVATPPQSVGKYGGDTDNWMWPRHTGDFALFRIYAGKDNKPAAYSKENVPYKPKKYLPVSLSGVKEGDFIMVYGFPGRTNRYENSYGIKLAIETVNPAIVTLRDERLKAWKTEMDKSDSVRLLMSSRYAGIANYWKYFIGQTEQLKRLKVYDEKKNFEARFTKWAESNGNASILPDFGLNYEGIAPFALHSVYLSEGVFGSGILAFAAGFSSLEKALESKNADEIKKSAGALKQRLSQHFGSFNHPSEEKILAAMLRKFYSDIPAVHQPASFTALAAKHKAGRNPEAFSAIARGVFAKSMFASKASTEKFLDQPDLKKLQKDPAYTLVKSFMDNYNSKIKSRMDAFREKNAELGSKYVKAIMQFEPEKKFYPDANGTLRLSYGTVQPYQPKDAVAYSYYTTLSGVMEKENPKSFEFIVPPVLKELYAKKDFGQYANEKGELVVGFISNNDITGGNSGSPVINGKGELVGVAFDGNWEAMSGDIFFDSKYKRTITCDVRYILFMLDKFGGAHNLVKELKVGEGKEGSGTN